MRKLMNMLSDLGRLAANTILIAALVIVVALVTVVVFAGSIRTDPPIGETIRPVPVLMQNGEGTLSFPPEDVEVNRDRSGNLVYTAKTTTGSLWWKKDVFLVTDDGNTLRPVAKSQYLSAKTGGFH